MSLLLSLIGLPLPPLSQYPELRANSQMVLTWQYLRFFLKWAQTVNPIFTLALSDEKFHFLSKVTSLKMRPKMSQTFQDYIFCVCHMRNGLAFIPSHFIKPFTYSLFSNIPCLSIFFLLNRQPQTNNFSP